ncbi:MAG: BamA/TamA family outer membrane protein [Ignavibacteria bacterium]|nr:BamA/TamA family outer membrane protein [Ignavibacteria bacterium]
MYLLIIIGLSFSSASFCQIFNNNSNNQSHYILDSIKIFGNDITEDFIILRELTFEPGDTVDQHILEYNKERVYSLGIFNKVNFRFQDIDSTILNIEIEESWYIYPIPFFQIKDNDWDKFSYGISILVKNFRGRNETLTGSAALGYDPSFSISYFKPSIIYKSNVYFNVNLSHRTITNRSAAAANLYGNDFEYTYIINEVGIGNRFGLFHWAGFDIGFNYVESPKYFKGSNASNERIDRLLKLGFSYSYDTRDLIQFPSEGMLFFFYMQFKGLGLNNTDYRIFNIDFREYRNLIGDLTAKWRVTTRQTAGKLIPYYDFSYLGFEERIRGHFSKEREGNNYYLGSVELFHPIIKDINITLDFIPLLPRELLTYRLALYAQLFADTGTTHLRGNPLSIKNFDTGYGIGFSLLLLPYNILRFEIATDENQNVEYILNLGVSF